MARMNKQQRQIEEIRKKLEPSVRAAFDLAIQNAKQSIDLKTLVALLEQAKFGDLEPAVQFLKLSEGTLFPVTEAIRTVYIAGGQSVAGSIPTSIAARFGFGGNPRAVASVNQIVGELIENVTTETLLATRAVVAAGVGQGVPPARLARDIVGRNINGKPSGGLLGLNTQQLQWHQNVKDILSDPARIREYFIQDRATGQWKPRYTTTNRTFDARVLRAIKEGRALTRTEMAPIILRHEQRLLRLRGETIARNETLNALRKGRHDGFGTLLDTGLVTNDELYRTWSSASDARVRPDHVAMNGQVRVGLDTPFDFPDGSQAMFPGDGELGAPAEQLIQCRCAETVRMVRPGQTVEPT